MDSSDGSRKLGGMFIIGFILLVMNYNHPFSKEARLYFYTTPIVPLVRGPVIEVPVISNVPLKKEDVLFKIRPEDRTSTSSRKSRRR